MASMGASLNSLLILQTKSLSLGSSISNLKPVNKVHKTFTTAKLKTWFIFRGLSNCLSKSCNSCLISSCMDSSNDDFPSPKSLSLLKANRLCSVHSVPDEKRTPLASCSPWPKRNSYQMPGSRGHVRGGSRGSAPPPQKKWGRGVVTPIFEDLWASLCILK